MYKEDPRFVLAAVVNDANALMDTSDTLKEDTDFLLKAIRQNPNVDNKETNRKTKELIDNVLRKNDKLEDKIDFMQKIEKAKSDFIDSGNQPLEWDKIKIYQQSTSSGGKRRTRRRRGKRQQKKKRKTKRKNKLKYKK